MPLSLYQEVLFFLQDRLGIKLRSEVDVRIANRLTGKQWYGRNPVGQAGSDTVRGRGYCIAIRKYALPIEVEYFLAHELAHIWQFENTIRYDNKKLVEGFACWVESQLARERENEEWITLLLDDQNPIYGDGFRFLHKLEQKYEKKAIPAIYKQLVR